MHFSILLLCLFLSVSANLIQNGDFEKNNCRQDSCLCLPPCAEIFPWVLSDGSIDIKNKNAIYQLRNSSFAIDTCGQTPGTIYQNFSTQIGYQYRVDFIYSANPGGNRLPKRQMLVYVQNAPFLSFEVDVTSFYNISNPAIWQNGTYSFNATSNVTKLTFQGIASTNILYGVIIDNVVVVEIPSITELKDNSIIYYAIGGASAGLIVTVGAIVLVVIIFKKRKATNPSATEIPVRLSQITISSPNEEKRGSTYEPIQARASFDLKSPNKAVLPPRRTNNKKKDWIIEWNEITLVSEIGKGAFGVVFQATWRTTPVAVKQLRAESKNKAYTENFMREVEVMKDMKYHMNVLQMYGACMEPLALITEFVERGSLHQYLQSKNTLDEKTKLHIITGIARGMFHLHCQGLVHRDLAARNVLLSNTFDPKISDFGLSKFIGEEEGNITTSNVGPLRWMAPELIRDRIYGTKTDVWSFGATIIEIYTRRVPFPELEGLQVAAKVAREELTIPNLYQAPPKVNQLVRDCMRFNSAHRPSFEEISNVLSQ